jgi:hypothetical protein
MLYIECNLYGEVIKVSYRESKIECLLEILLRMVRESVASLII